MSELLGAHSGICLSLYLPTFRRFPEHQQNPVRFRNILRDTAKKVAADVGETQADEFLAPLYALAENQAFWAHPQDGLAVFRANDFLRVMKLQRAVPERAIIADSFHTKPLLRIVQSADRFQLLALTREHIRFFQGSRDAIDEVDLAEGVPRSMVDALGDEVTEAHKIGTGSPRGGHSPSASFVRQGTGSRKDEVDKDNERWFRIVDRAIFENYSKQSGLPLLLAALPEHHAPFRQLSHNPHLAEEAIAVNPDALDIESLRAKAWEVFGPRYVRRLEQLVDEFNAASAHGTASDEIDAVAMAAIGGRVKTLLVEANKVIHGSIDLETGRVTRSDSNATKDDLLDDLAELTIRAGGEVVVVPPERFPTQSGVAATYRF